MEKIQLRPFRQDTALTGYMPLPRSALTLGLSGTALLLYAVLLDRGTLSRKNSFTDSAGQVYVIYPIEKLAQTLGKGTTTVKRCLEELEKAGLVRRRRVGMNCTCHIFLSLPEDCFQTLRESENGPADSPKPDGLTARKGSSNNRRKQLDKSNYYQHSEEESL